MTELAHTAGDLDSRSATPLRVLIVTESTYPFYWGGLSTWCHALIKELHDVEFTVAAISADPFPQVRFELPENVVDFRAMPLWGVRSAWEIDSQLTGREARARRRRATAEAIETGFVPLYREFLSQLLGAQRDDELLASTLHAMYRFFQRHDFDTTFRSERAWEVFCDEADKRFPALAESIGVLPEPLTLGEILDGWQWTYHWLFPLSQSYAEVDVAHATMGGTCSMVALVCKREQGAGFLLSEHGVYLREMFLAAHDESASAFCKLIKVAFARRMTEIAYTYADAIAPCCDYNQRWETRVGADADRLWTAYYGIDPQQYLPVERAPDDAPVVVWAGRIDPLKDVETLLHAAALVKTLRPEVQFRLYGSASIDNGGYLEQCIALHAELGLEDTVTFEGFTSDIVAAFGSGDIVVLSSISEGFPFATLEAMACGKPVIATAVGGVPEQISNDCGRVVRPRDARALAGAMLEILGDVDLCRELSVASRARATALFGVERFVTTHRSIYDLVLVERQLSSVQRLESPVLTDLARSNGDGTTRESPVATTVLAEAAE